MKRFLFLLPSLIIGIIFFSSCKQTTSPGGGISNQVVMTATVNGKAWSGIIPFTGHSNQYLDFSAGDSISDIGIYYTQTDTGTFPVNGTAGGDLYATYLHGANDYYVSYANSGTVRFTTNDSSHVVGTFAFDAVDDANDTVKITNGTFDIAR